MVKYKGLSEFVRFNTEFRNSINLDLNLNHREKLLSYIPTKSSVDILKRYLKAVQNNTMHSTMLIGPYGKGKSHLLLVLLAILSLDNNNKEDAEIYEQLYEKINKVDAEAAEYINKLWTNGSGRFLPVIINCQDDINQAFMLGLNKALKRNKLEDITPKTDYVYAVETITNWMDNYPETYSQYHKILKSKRINLNSMKAELLQYNIKYLELFKTIYPHLTSGSIFNPLAESDITRVYMSVADKLREDYGYRGIYIVFDEFSKFIEGQDKISAGLNMKLVQDICEMACDSKDPQVYVTLVAHKPIKEYGNRLGQEIINSFTGIEGRLDAEIFFTTSTKNNYELIQNAILKDGFELKKMPKEICDIYFSKKTVSDNFSIPGYSAEFIREDFEKIVVKGCYPLTPISSFLLLNISEKVAQNERTLFTFISKDEPGSMPQFINSSVGTDTDVSDKWSVTPDLIFDYFTNLFKNESDDVRSIYQRATIALEIASNKYSHNEPAIKIIKTLAVMMIVGKYQELPWNEDTLRLALNMNYSKSRREMFDNAVINLKEMDILELDGNNNYKFKTIEGKELENVIEERWRLVTNKNTIKENLQKIYPDKYVFPKKYNYEFGMTRFFRYSFYEVNDFLSFSSVDIFFKNSLFCDGRIICLYQFDEKNYCDDIKQKLAVFSSYKIVIMYSRKLFEIEEDVLKLQVVQDIKEDFHFIEKNGHLLSEIDGLLDSLENKILKFLNTTYGRFGEYEIYYLLNNEVVSDSVRSISECIDDLCYQIYTATPVINNEFVNKQNITTGATKTARKNIMQRLLNCEGTEDYLSGTSQDATIYRALFVRNGVAEGKPDKLIKVVLDIFKDYIGKCSGKRKKLSCLTDIICKEPYGIRLGLIPIYLSYIIGQSTSDIVVYYGDKEIPLTVDTIINMCDYPAQYELFVSETDAKREEYLNTLVKMFDINIDSSIRDSRINQIFSGMQRWYRSLPQVTINAKNNKEFFKEDYYKKALIHMGNILQRYGTNPFEALFILIPNAFDSKDNYVLCLSRLDDFKEKMMKYYEWTLNQAIGLTKQVFKSEEDSLHHILVGWYDKQSNMAKGIIDDQSVSSFMKVVAELKNEGISNISNDIKIVDNIAKSVTGVHIDYWNSNSLGQFEKHLCEIKEKIELIKDVKTGQNNNKLVYTSQSGQQFFYELVESDATEMFRDILSGTIDDFDGLSKNDLVAVLLNEVERILNDKEYIKR